MAPESATHEDRQIAIEQYKVYVNAAIGLSNKRSDENRFYMAILSSFVAATYAIMKLDGLKSFQSVLIIVVGLLGLFVAISWKQRLVLHLIRSRAKFVVIYKLEEYLGHYCFKSENEAFNSECEKKKNSGSIDISTLTEIEMKLSTVFSIIFVVIMVIGLFNAC